MSPPGPQPGASASSATRVREEGGGVEPLPCVDTPAFKAGCGPARGTFQTGTRGGSRTRNGTSAPPDPKSGASASSATRAKNPERGSTPGRTRTCTKTRLRRPALSPIELRVCECTRQDSNLRHTRRFKPELFQLSYKCVSLGLVGRAGDCTREDVADSSTNHLLRLRGHQPASSRTRTRTQYDLWDQNPACCQLHHPGM